MELVRIRKSRLKILNVIRRKRRLRNIAKPLIALIMEKKRNQLTLRVFLQESDQNKVRTVGN